MENEKSKFERNENPDKKIRQEFESEGWQFVGNEVTHMTPFNAETGRFDPKEIKTAEQLEKEFIGKYGQRGFNEIKLIRPHIEKGILGFAEDKHSYDVYMRKPEV